MQKTQVAFLEDSNDRRIHVSITALRKALGSRPHSQNFGDAQTCLPRALMTCVTRASKTVLMSVSTNVGRFIQYIGHKYCICKESRGVFGIFKLESIFATAFRSELRFLYGNVMSVFLLLVYCGAQECVLGA